MKKLEPERSLPDSYAELKIRHLPRAVSCEYEVEEEPDSTDEKVWSVWIQKIEKENSSEGVNALRGPEKMTKAEFMKQCEGFWDNRGTHFNDFEVMYIRLTEVRV